ncbi:MAG: hypothetical protein QMD85_03885 [Candidatus Aenigmarchaeota archaeon]|nr:hypothetical protein [Candidatus Aenigmarchaeota archaeon]MDI6722697.1 hypothetical protein [Candidatus Aenigmarchaeota archaeon]
MNLNKSRGPSDAGVGTMVEIYKIRKKGIAHIFADDWKKAGIQYPADSLTDEQWSHATELAEDRTHELFVGTVALSRPPHRAVVLDLNIPEFYGYNNCRVWQIYRPEAGSFPVGTRVAVGYSKNEPSRIKVFEL